MFLSCIASHLYIELFAYQHAIIGKKRIFNEATSLEKNPCSALWELIESLVLIEMNPLFTFADPLFQH